MADPLIRIIHLQFVDRYASAPVRRVKGQERQVKIDIHKLQTPADQGILKHYYVFPNNLIIEAEENRFVSLTSHPDGLLFVQDMMYMVEQAQVSTIELPEMMNLLKIWIIELKTQTHESLVKQRQECKQLYLYLRSFKGARNNTNLTDLQVERPRPNAIQIESDELNLGNLETTSAEETQTYINLELMFQPQ